MYLPIIQDLQDYFRDERPFPVRDGSQFDPGLSTTPRSVGQYLRYIYVY